MNLSAYNIDSGNAIAEGAVRYSLDNNLVQDHFSRSCVCITQHLRMNRTPLLSFKRVAYQYQLEGKKYVPDCVQVLLRTVIASRGDNRNSSKLIVGLESNNTFGGLEDREEALPHY